MGANSTMNANRIIKASPSAKSRSGMPHVVLTGTSGLSAGGVVSSVIGLLSV